MSKYTEENRSLKTYPFSQPNPIPIYQKIGVYIPIIHLWDIVMIVFQKNGK